MSKINEEYKSDKRSKKRAKPSDSNARDENIANGQDAPPPSDGSYIRQNTKHTPHRIITEPREIRHRRERSETLFDQELDELITEIEATNLGSSFIPISPVSDQPVNRPIHSLPPQIISATAYGDKRKLSNSDDRTTSSAVSSPPSSPPNMRKKTRIMDR